MRLNYDCIRDVLLVLEKLLVVEYNDEYECFESNIVSINEIYDALPQKKYYLEDVYYTIKNLSEAGYISVNSVRGDGEIMEYDVYDITFKGNEYINTIRSDKIWDKIKKSAFKIGSLSLPIITNISTSLATSIILNQLNLPCP